MRCEASHLLSNQLVAFPEDVAALGVSQDHPVHPAVLYHGRTGAARQQCSGGLKYFNIHQPVQQLMSVSSQLIPDLPCKRSLGHLVAVLGRDADLGVQTGASEVQVDGWSAAHHL